MADAHVTNAKLALSLAKLPTAKRTSLTSEQEKLLIILLLFLAMTTHSCTALFSWSVSSHGKSPYCPSLLTCYDSRGSNVADVSQEKQKTKIM